MLPHVIIQLLERLPNGGQVQCIPACQERLRRRVTVFKVGGTFLGDGDACASALLELMRAKLEKPLSYIVRMRDSGRVRHARLLQLQLVRLCACSIPNHWMRTMPPTQTEGAAAFADEATGNAAALILDFGRSPGDRAALARTRAKQTGKNGGIGMSDYARRRFPSFLASAVTSQRACARVYPALGEMSLTPPNTATATALVAAHGVIDSALADVRTRHAALDEQVRHWVDGATRSAYHPHLKRGFQLPPLAALLGDADGTSSSCLSQHSLSAVVNNGAWLVAKDACDSFDSQNAGATVPHREATSLISHSQVGSGAWLLRLPDATVPRSIIPSDAFLSACQHRLGLYLTALDDVYNALEERGVTVTQHQRLGDHCLNSANATHRHNAALAAVHRALTSVTSDALPVGSIQLADKGDGTPASKAERKGYYAHVNKGHIPDLIRFGSTTTCWEFKCYTPFLPSGAKGNGSARCGGAASRADGHFIALGNTEEHLSVVVLGHPQRGDPDTEEQLDRVSGDGWVAAKDGDYADALAKGHTVILLVTESTGAFSADLDRVLRQLARTARASGSIDHTPYGTSRASTRSHYTFHSAAISAAIVTADALTIQNSAAALGFELTLDPRDLARRSTSGPRPPLRSAPPPPPAPPAATAARPPMRPTPPSFPDPALNAPDSEARAARGTPTDSTSDPRA